MKFFILFFLLFSCSTVPTNHPKFTVVKCGFVFDSKSGAWIKDQTLLIRNGIISEVNPKSIPSGALVLDYSKQYVIPGLIDAHTHVFLDDPTFTKEFAQGLLDFVQKTSDQQRTELGRARLKSLLQSGFTSVRDLGNNGDVAVSSVNEGSRIYSSGDGFSPQFGQFPQGTAEKIIWKEYRPLTKLPEDFPYDLVKVYADEEPNYSFADQKTLNHLVHEAHKRKLKVAAHGILKEGIERAINANVDSLEHGSEISDDQLRSLSKKDIILVPTYADVLLSLPLLKKYKISQTDEVVNRNCGNIKRALSYKVPLAFGSDNYFSFEKENLSFGEATLEILLAYEKCGMNPLQLLRASTFEAARTMGKEKVVGQITIGAHADFIVLKNNPSESLKELKTPYAIYQDGKKVD